jgi:hypothetical protein
VLLHLKRAERERVGFLFKDMLARKKKKLRYDNEKTEISGRLIPQNKSFFYYFHLYERIYFYYDFLRNKQYVLETRSVEACGKVCLIYTDGRGQAARGIKVGNVVVANVVVL